MPAVSDMVASTPSNSEDGHTSDSTHLLPSENPADPATQQSAAKKKKKKKKSKAAKAASSNSAPVPEPAERPTVICISRNKHWKYISSYHGPWLQLPVELLDSLMILNREATPTTVEPQSPTLPSYSTASPAKPRPKTNAHQGFPDLSEFTPPDTPRLMASANLPPAFPPQIPGKATPPPIDPGVFKCVVSIRRLIDEASELSVRASSGMSSAELNAMRNGGGLAGLSASPWAAAQTLGLNPLGVHNGTGRNVAMSAIRIHRLRALAVSKLAQAYQHDEIASSVMVMQGGSVFDDLAEKVLKTDPNDADAKYVHFFHEKIPSRQMAESTPTKILDDLIAAYPHKLEVYRTRGIVHCFRDEYPEAIKDFSHALKESRALRKAKQSHANGAGSDGRLTKSSKRKKASGKKTNGQAPPDGTCAAFDFETSETGDVALLHPSVLPDAPEPLEHQLLFHRGATYLHHVMFLIERAVLDLEGVEKNSPTFDGIGIRLCYLDDSKYGGTEIGNPAGPLGSLSGRKFKVYRQLLNRSSFRDQVTSLLRKSVRDHEKFISHFDTLDSPGVIPDVDLAKQVEYSFLLSESHRPGHHHPDGPAPRPAGTPDLPPMFTTYHPLLVEAHYSILICQLMLADFSSLLPNFVRVASIVDGLEGYPVFLPPRSMAQAEYIEVLERLAGGWEIGTQPHSMSGSRSKGKAIKAAPPPSPPDSPSSLSPARLNGSSSSAPSDDAAGSSTSAATTPSVERPETPFRGRADAEEALDYARMLLAPVYARQKKRAAKEKALVKAKKDQQQNFSIPLHGPRVDLILAWLGAVHLPELEPREHV